MSGTLIEFMVRRGDEPGVMPLITELCFATYPANITEAEAIALRPKIAYAIRLLYQIDDRCEDTIKISRRERTR